MNDETCEKMNLTDYEIRIETGLDGEPCFSVTGASHCINIAILDENQDVQFAGFPHTIIYLQAQLALHKTALRLACESKIGTDVRSPSEAIRIADNYQDGYLTQAATIEKDKL